MVSIVVVQCNTFITYIYFTDTSQTWSEKDLAGPPKFWGDSKIVGSTFFKSIGQDKVRGRVMQNRVVLRSLAISMVATIFADTSSSRIRDRIQDRKSAIYEVLYAISRRFRFAHKSQTQMTYQCIEISNWHLNILPIRPSRQYVPCSYDM